MSEYAKAIASGDYISLPSEDDYADYYNRLNRIFLVLNRWCELLTQNGSEEGKILDWASGAFQRSVELLRQRQLFHPDHTLKLDLNASGFPHAHAIDQLGAERLGLEEELRQMPSLERLKQHALDVLMTSAENPMEELGLIARREYLEALRGSDFLGRFTFGGIASRGQTQRRKHYFAYWACYDRARNLPCVYTLLFDYTGGGNLLDVTNEERRQLIEMIGAEGGRIPPLAVLAISLDEHSDLIHPKVMKRTTLGPLLLPRFTFDNDELAVALKALGGSRDFCLHLRTETVLSSNEVVKEKGGWWRPDKIRQVFHIPATDLECAEARVTQLHNYLLLPHAVQQHILDSSPELRETLREYHLYAFDERNYVNS